MTTWNPTHGFGDYDFCVDCGHAFNPDDLTYDDDPLCLPCSEGREATKEQALIDNEIDRREWQDRATDIEIDHAIEVRVFGEETR